MHRITAGVSHDERPRSAHTTFRLTTLARVFQVMECDDVTLLQRWVANWEDVADFEIVPVAAGGSAVAEAVLRG